MTTVAHPLPAASPSLPTTGAAGRILKLDPALARALDAAGGSLPATVAGKALGGATTLATLHGEITLKLAALLKPGLNVTLALPQNPAPNMAALVLPARGRDPAMGERAPASAAIGTETKAPAPATAGRVDQTQSRALPQPGTPNARPAAGLDAPSLEVLARAVHQGSDAPIKQIAPRLQAADRQPPTAPAIQPQERPVPVSAEQKLAPPLSRGMTQSIDRQFVPDAARTAPQPPPRVEVSNIPVNKQPPTLPRSATEPPLPVQAKGALQQQVGSPQPTRPMMLPLPATEETPIAPILPRAENKAVSDSIHFQQLSKQAPRMSNQPQTPPLADRPQPNLIPHNRPEQPQRLPAADSVQVGKNVNSVRTLVSQPDTQQRPVTSQTGQSQNQAMPQAPDTVAQDARPPKSTVTPLPAQSLAEGALTRPEVRTQSTNEPAPHTPRPLSDTRNAPLSPQQQPPAMAAKQSLTQSVRPTASPAGAVVASPATAEIPQPSTNQTATLHQPVARAVTATGQMPQPTLPPADLTGTPAAPAQVEVRPAPAPPNLNPPPASSPTTPATPMAQPVQPPNIAPAPVQPPVQPLGPIVSRIPETPPIPQPTQAPISTEPTRAAASSGQSQPAPIPAAPASAPSALTTPPPAVISDRATTPPPVQPAPQPAQPSPEMQAVVQVLTRPPGPETADLLRTNQPAALEQQATNADAENAIDDPDADVPDLRLDLIAAPLDRNGSGYRYDQSNGADTAENDALIAEADLSVLGSFRLETRPAAQGLNVVIRHAEPLNAAGLEALGAAAEAEAQRFGVQARVKFRHEPDLEPT